MLPAPFAFAGQICFFPVVPGKKGPVIQHAGITLDCWGILAQAGDGHPSKPPSLQGYGYFSSHIYSSYGLPQHGVV